MSFVNAQIYVGVMRWTGDSLKPIRGKSLPPDIQPHWSSEQLLTAAVKKQISFNKDMQDIVHVLLYPDGREVINIPGTDDPFTIQKYHETRSSNFVHIRTDIQSKYWIGASLKQIFCLLHRPLRNFLFTQFLCRFPHTFLSFFIFRFCPRST